MAKKNVTPAEEPQVKEPAAQEPQQLSARDRYRSRYSEKHPDLNLDDDEAFYTQANANLDELENFRESDRMLGEAFDKTPLLAGLVLAAKEGENPFTYLAENIGPDMDIRELANNPEFSQKMGEALTKYQEGVAKDAQTRKEIGENYAKSMDALKELCAERGMSDEDRLALIKKMYGDYDDLDENGNAKDYGIFGNASIGIVPKEIWEAVLKAENYDADIKAASDKAAATALNAKVQNGLKTFGNQVVPNLGSNSGGRRAPKKDDGSLRSFGENLVG